MLKIEKEWENIKNSIRLTVGLLASFGYSRKFNICKFYYTYLLLFDEKKSL